MKNQDQAREVVANLMHTVATPKAAIADLQQYASVPGVETTLHDLKALAWNAKAKAAPILADLLEKLDADEGDAVGGAPRLVEIETSIQALQETAASALLEVGSLLNEAREEFSNAAEFLAWALEKFGMKKAYTYRLMNVAEKFTKDDVLAGQSIAVLHKLAAMPEEVKQAARDKVEAGETLTSSEVKRLKVDEEGEAAPQESSTAVDVLGQGEDEGAPWNENTGREVSPGAAPKLVQQESSDSAEVKQLRELVSELQAELAAARQERESKGKAKQAMPMLPQFSSACMYARLGLSAEQGQSPEEVRKAFRALVKAGYNSQHEAYPALVEAKDALDEQHKAAA